jgi:hypothetical protein
MPKSITAAGQIPVDLTYFDVASGNSLPSVAVNVTFQMKWNNMGLQYSQNETSQQTYGGTNPFFALRHEDGSSSPASTSLTAATQNLGSL